MTTYICKCGQRVQKSSNADNTGNRLEGYGPGHECYGCPYAMPWGGNKWDKAAKRFVQDIKGYECRTSRTLSYDSHFIGSTKDKCTCSVVSLDFGFLEQISAWVKDTFPLGELTGGFSQDEIRPTDYSHNGRYCCTFVCASNKKGIAAKAALFARFFDPDGSRKGITPQQEMEKILADIRKCTQEPPAAEDAAVAALPPAEAAAPGFDFGADAQTNALLLQDAQTFITGNMARIMAAKHAHDLTANHYKGSWGRWCAAVGISRDTGDNMVRVAEQFGNIEIEGKPILDVQPLKLLYAAAKPSTPQEIKEAVFSGDITTYKEYQDVMAQLKAEQERAAAAEAREEEAWKMQSKAEARAKTAESQLEAAHADIDGLQEQCAQMSQRANDAEEARIAARLQCQKAEAERDKAEERVRDAEEALKHQPIVGVIDEEEIDRRADARNAELAKDNADLKKQIAALHSKISDAAQADFENANSIAFSCRRAWDTGKGSYSRLVGEDLETTFASLCETLNSIREEAARLCRQPPEYDGGGEDE